MLKEDRILLLLLPVLLVIKVSWILLTITHFFVMNNDYGDKYGSLVGNIEEAVHIFYNILMGILLIYLYNNLLTPNTVCINNETKKFLYMFGILMIIGNFQKSFHMFVFGLDR